MTSTTATRKRKADATSAPALKKAKLAATLAGAQTVNSILVDTENYDFPEDPEDVRRVLVELAQYARSLEEEVNASKPKERTKEELEAAAERLRNAARSGIRKQMTPSCKTGSARWTYDGVCNDPEIFSALLGLEGPPKFKTKKIPSAEFETLIGDLHVSIRYDTLQLTSDVNIHWKPNDSTFKFSGSYGK